MQRKSSKYFETNSVPPSGDTTKKLRSETFTGTTKHEIINSSLAVPRIKMRNTIRGLGDTMCTPDRFTAQGATPSSSGGNTGTCLTDFRTSKRGRKSAGRQNNPFPPAIPSNQPRRGVSRASHPTETRKAGSLLSGEQTPEEPESIKRISPDPGVSSFEIAASSDEA